jgi:hypothetical protein
MDAQQVAKEGIFKTFRIDENHNAWGDKDDEYADRLYKLMNMDRNPKHATANAYFESARIFLTRVNETEVVDWMYRSDYGVLYLVAKRIIYKHYNQKLMEIKVSVPVGPFTPKDERPQKMEDAVKHFACILPCDKFIVTGSFALYKYGLMSDASDLDIILVNPQPAAMEVLDKLSHEEVPKHIIPNMYTCDVSLIRIMYTGIKVDFLTSSAYIPCKCVELKDGTILSSLEDIVKTKKHYNKLKHWLQLNK